MTEMYCKHLPLSKDLDPQENMHGEELLVMACNVLVQVLNCMVTSFVLILFYFSLPFDALVSLLYIHTHVHTILPGAHRSGERTDTLQRCSPKCGPEAVIGPEFSSVCLTGLFDGPHLDPCSGSGPLMGQIWA